MRWRRRRLRAQRVAAARREEEGLFGFLEKRARGRRQQPVVMSITTRDGGVHRFRASDLKLDLRPSDPGITPSGEALGRTRGMYEAEVTMTIKPPGKRARRP